MGRTAGVSSGRVEGDIAAEFDALKDAIATLRATCAQLTEAKKKMAKEFEEKFEEKMAKEFEEKMAKEREVFKASLTRTAGCVNPTYRV